MPEVPVFLRLFYSLAICIPYRVARGLCYNLAAVGQAAKKAVPASLVEQADARAPQILPEAEESAASELRGEYALRYCPVCSERLESRRCKLICNRCGYYMSCADYI